jgi:hypothetical protein
MRNIPPWPPYDPYAGSYRTPWITKAIVPIIMILVLALVALVAYEAATWPRNGAARSVPTIFSQDGK